MRLAMGTELLHASNSDPVFRRVTTENYALDSYQNLLFSVARFREFTGHFPERITVIGYEFKRMRFTQLHRVAIRWPEAKFRYIGVDPDEAHSPSAEQGEVWMYCYGEIDPDDKHLLFELRDEMDISLTRSINTVVTLFYCRSGYNEILIQDSIHTT
jgi:hypothetical protein